MTTRRDFLIQLGAGAAGLMGLSIMSGCESITVNAETGGLVDFITPADHPTWYWKSGEGIKPEESPDIPRDEWSLAIEDPGGNTVEEIDFQTLEQHESDGRAITYIKTMRCVFGAQVGGLAKALVSTGIFKGIPLHHLLEPHDFSDLAKLRTFGADEFESNISMARALEPGPDPMPVILAYEINGRQMPAVRGGPVRLLIPEMWGYKNMKWLDRIQATDKVKQDLDQDDDEEFFGDYEHEVIGDKKIIDDPAIIALNSTITKPAAVRQDIEGPGITIAGVSFAGGTAIDQVELSLDDGPFEQAEILDRETSKQQMEPDFIDAFEAADHSDDHWPPANVWALWSKTYEDLSTGEHAVTVRATDTDGTSQPESTDDEHQIAAQKRVPFTVV